MSEVLLNTQAASSLAERIESRTARIGVVGLGYVGLPLISAFTNAGFNCLGFDVDWAKVQALKEGESYIKHIASQTVADWIEREVLEPTSQMERLCEADVVLICVPTPLNSSRDPDLTYVEDTARSIAAVLRPGQLIILESTTYPTTAT
jgi:UDP-N-acetyl-D-glucosamine dehydrogenase